MYCLKYPPSVSYLDHNLEEKQLLNMLKVQPLDTQKPFKVVSALKSRGRAKIVCGLLI